MSDEMAVGVDRGGHVARACACPEDLSVVGFDDTPTALDQSPPLTTVHQPLADKGAAAVRAAARRRPTATAPSITLPVELVVRGVDRPRHRLATASQSPAGGRSRRPDSPVTAGLLRSDGR